MRTSEAGCRTTSVWSSGDSVLGLVVTATLYTQHPDTSEGQLAKLRAAVVTCVRAGYGWAHPEPGRLSAPRSGRGGHRRSDKDSILADTVEAIIGAVYSSCGLEAASKVVHHLVDPLIEHSAQLGAALDGKTSLQEISARHSLGLPEYAIEEDGPEHAKIFAANVRVGETVRGTGVGRTKKVAEQEAAANAWAQIRAEFGEDG